MANKIAKTFSEKINSAKFQQSILNTLGNEMRTKEFTSAMVSLVTANPELAKCEVLSILSSAFQGVTLGLEPSPQLGQFYIVPYGGKAQFILGAKGFRQLAIRSGLYSTIDFKIIKQGEYLGLNEQTGVDEFKYIRCPDTREALPTVGYLATIELKNGLKKTAYWSKNKMIDHADQYSKSFNKKTYNDPKINNPKTPWYTSFDRMAEKTLLKYIISNYGIVNSELAKAVSIDYAETILNEETGALQAIPVENEEEQEIQEVQEIKEVQDTPIDVTPELPELGEDF